MYRTGDLVRWTGGVSWSSSAAPTTRSRSAASASSSARSRPRCSATHPGRADAVVVAREDRRAQAAGRLRGACAGGARDALAARAARARWPTAARLHGAGRVRGAGPPAAHRQRQARPPGAAGAGLAPQRRGLRGAAHRGARWPIWAEVLGLPRVGVDDNFFELGGDSILSIQVVARARQAGLRLTPRTCSSAPDHRRAGAGGGPTPTAGRAGPGHRRRCRSPRSSTGSSSRPRPPRTTSTSRCSCSSWPRDVDEDGAGARRASALVATTTRCGCGSTRGTAAGGADNAPRPARSTCCSATCLPPRGRGRPRRSPSGRAAHAAGLDLAAGPLLRAVLLHRGAGRGRLLLLAAHHLVVDGVSWRILLEDLETAYRRLARGASRSTCRRDHLVPALGASG